tara:strand:+ start:361 stop:1722 length:1362 start_codon:yes stop_codon:yes gene_type:complete
MSNPDNVQYSTNPVEGVAAESDLRIFRSENETYAPTGNRTIIIPLNCSDKSFIDFSDSVLSFRIMNRSQSASTATLANAYCRASDFIQDLTIVGPQGNEIEIIRNYNVLMGVLDDYSYGANHAASVEHILSGGSDDGTVGGKVLIKAGTGTTAGAAQDGESYTFCEKLVCGTLSNRYLVPLGWTIGQATRIVIRLADAGNALWATGAANGDAFYKIDNVEFRAKQIVFNSLFNAQFEANLAEAGESGMSYIGETFLHAQNNLASGSSGLNNLQFSLNPRSAKYILTSHRLESKVALITAKSLNDRSSINIDQYSYDIMGKQIPMAPIDLANASGTSGSINVSQGFAQVLDALGLIGAVNRDTLCSLATAETLFYSPTQTAASKYVSAIVLEDFDSSNNPSIFSGLNLSSAGSMSYRPRQASGTTAAAAYRIDHFMSCDMQIRFTLDGRLYSIK